ncbi:MAG: FHA domain-containing protein [Ruminococcus sp.]|nr:FHA domain-containing protein [Ruminococcus sp.]
MNSTDLILCAIAAAALDICAMVLIISAYTERRSSKRYWKRTTGLMELTEPGVQFPLDCDELLIGRHASADIRLADISVSRYHAMLTVDSGRWTITDIGSKSGIFINGNLVKKAVLRENDMISIGSHRLVFRRRREKSE